MGKEGNFCFIVEPFASNVGAMDDMSFNANVLMSQHRIQMSSRGTHLISSLMMMMSLFNDL